MRVGCWWSLVVDVAWCLAWYEVVGRMEVGLAAPLAVLWARNPDSFLVRLPRQRPVSAREGLGWRGWWSGAPAWMCMRSRCGRARGWRGRGAAGGGGGGGGLGGWGGWGGCVTGWAGWGGAGG